MLMDLKFTLKCACGWASYPWLRQLIQPNDFVGPVVFLPTMLFISHRNVSVIVSCMNVLPSKQWNHWIPLICVGKQREMQMLYSYWFCKIVDGCNTVVYRSKRLYKSAWNIIWRNICKKKQSSTKWAYIICCLHHWKSIIKVVCSGFPLNLEK